MHDEGGGKRVLISSMPSVQRRLVEPGETLFFDIPLGLEDTVERLIHASALRSYVPEIFTSPIASLPMGGRYEDILLTLPVNTPYRHTLSADPINPLYQYTISNNTINPLY